MSFNLNQNQNQNSSVSVGLGCIIVLGFFILAIALNWLFFMGFTWAAWTMFAYPIAQTFWNFLAFIMFQLCFGGAAGISSVINSKQK